MEDNLSKFLKIAGLVLLTAITFLLALILIILGLRFFFGLFGHMPWVALVYKMVILVLPAALFVNVYIQFYRLTRRKELNGGVKLLSYLVFMLAVISWVLAYFYDLKNFVAASTAADGTTAGLTVKDYLSFNTFFLTAHVAFLILTGVMQAFAAPREKDWMEIARERQD